LKHNLNIRAIPSEISRGENRTIGLRVRKKLGVWKKPKTDSGEKVGVRKIPKRLGVKLGKQVGGGLEKSWEKTCQGR